jgi:arginyl-tRNA synthetase
MIREYIKKIVKKSLPSGVAPENFGLEHPRDPQHGDYSVSAPLVLAKKLKKPPLQIARDLAAKMAKADNEKNFVAVTVAPPGFVNIKLSDTFFAKSVAAIHKLGDSFGGSATGKGKKVIIEYSSPNTNKALHIGHFRNDAIGMAMSNILTAVGYKVVRSVLFNDRGRQICKGMLMYQKFGAGQTPETTGQKPDHFVASFYSRYEAAATRDPQLEEEVSQMLIKWEAGDKEVLKLWRQMNAWVYAGYKKTYAREGSVFDDYAYESKIYNQGKDIVNKYLKQGIFQKKSDGSVVVDLTKFGLDEKVLLRSDGTSIYITQDLYLGEVREKKYHPDQMLYVVDITQSYHFRVLFKIYELLGFKWARRSRHLAYGYVFLGQEKMSSRQGNVILTDDFIEEMKKRALATMKNSRIKTDPNDMDAVAEQLALGALKFGMLGYELKKEIHFDRDKTIQITGKTGPYLQYTQARIQGILRKSDLKNPKIDTATPVSDTASLALLRKLYIFPEIVAAAAQAYEPHLMTDYLYEVAQSFNSFYNEVPVLKADTLEQKSFRLSLAAATAQVLRNGLRLLGIAAPNKL